MTSPLSAHRVTLGYGDHTVCTDLTLTIPDRSFTAIIGPNACGKSTALRSLARLLTPTTGQVFLDSVDIATLPTKQVARRLGLLPQSSLCPAGITVYDLVARGRFPHQTLLRQWSAEDDAAIRRALDATGVTELADRAVDTLSGGQRQRVWLSLVLAQDTPILLLDEPTTYLDITHQLEVLKLCARLHASGAYTLVTVLHDLNLACRFASHLIVMKDGAIVAQGRPEDVMTEQLMADVYEIDCLIIPDPITGDPMIVPR